MFTASDSTSHNELYFVFFLSNKLNIEDGIDDLPNPRGRCMSSHFSLFFGESLGLRSLGMNNGVCVFVLLNLFLASL